MERRQVQVFEVEVTDLDGSVDVSAPTVVLSAAPLQACVRASAPTVRHVAPGRLPGKLLGTQPTSSRRAQKWSIEPPYETAPVGAIPMPGEHASAAVTLVQQAPRSRASDGPRAAAMTIVQQAPRSRACDGPSNAVTIVQQGPRSRACESPVQYSVEREVAALTTPRAAAPRWQPRDRRLGHMLVLLIGVLAGFVMVLSVVVVRQQRDLESMAEPAQRANGACAAYADEVRAIARQLTQAAGDVAEVESRIGERARRVVGDRGLQRLCAPQVDVACSQVDAACLVSSVMQLRQALTRR